MKKPVNFLTILPGAEWVLQEFLFTPYLGDEKNRKTRRNKMKFIDIDKLIEEARKKDPNVDVDRLFGELCVQVIRDKNSYRGSRALKASEVPKGLESEVRKYFTATIHKGFVKPFKFVRLEKSNINAEVIYVVPEDIYENIDEEDSKFDKELQEIGKRFGISIRLPWYCYGK